MIEFVKKYDPDTISYVFILKKDGRKFYFHYDCSDDPSSKYGCRHFVHLSKKSNEFTSEEERKKITSMVKSDPDVIKTGKLLDKAHEYHNCCECECECECQNGIRCPLDN